jgi:hypothetical protein
MVLTLFNLVSIGSTKNVDKSNSMLSNGDIWADNKSPDDSKQFIENFYDIGKKKNSQFKEKLKIPNNNLIINTNLTPIIPVTPVKSIPLTSSKDEDYNDDVDERIDPMKKENLISRNRFETNHNNLNEIYIYPTPIQPQKFYTCPNEAVIHRGKDLVTVTPSEHLLTSTSQFPKIPDTYKKEEPE